MRFRKFADLGWNVSEVGLGASTLAETTNTLKSPVSLPSKVDSTRKPVLPEETSSLSL